MINSFENSKLQEQEENSLEVGKIVNDLLKHKFLYLKVIIIASVIAVIYSLGIPNYYECVVKLSPEMSGNSGKNGLLSLASSFGVNLGTNTGGLGTEALFPTLYPELMNSVDFKTSLFSVPITIEGDMSEGIPNRTMTYYDYMENEQKVPWWMSVIGIPKVFFGWIKSLFTEKKDAEEVKKVDPFRLTMEQTSIVKAIDQNIVCEVDNKTMVITIKVTDQNPVICATMADTVKTRLQKFITDYRTSKARVDLIHCQKIYKETKARYNKARQKYAEFADANQNIILQSVRQRQVDLENEMQLQYNAYMQIAAQLLAAEAKVQEATPAFTTLQSATVPVIKAGPSRPRICVMILFLAIIITTVWALYKEDDLKQILGMN